MTSLPKNKLLQKTKLDQFCIDHAGVGIYQISESDGQIINVNRQACIDLGYSKEEFLNMTIFELDPSFSDPKQEKWHQHRKQIKENGTGTIETFHKRKDGTLLPVEVTITYLTFEGKNLSFSFARNITKRKIAENALKESEKLFRTALYSIGDGVITCNVEGKVRNLNKVAQELTGWTEKEAQGQHIEQVFHIINETTRKKVESPINKVFAEGKIVGLANHTLLISKDNRETPIADSGAPIFSDENEIVGAVLVFRDQSEERKYQKELEANRNYLATFLNNLPGMAFRCKNTLNWDMEFLSKGCKKLTGYEPEELLFNKVKSFGSLIHPDDRQMVWNKVQQAITNQTSYKIEYRILTRDNLIKWVWEQGEPIFSQNEGSLVIEGIINDITQQKEFEKKLQENDRLKTTFLQNVSHEIRTPLNAILGFSELINQPNLKEEERNQFINIVLSGGQKLLGILNNVLELSRIETGNISIKFTEIPTNKLLKEIYDLFEPQAVSKGLEMNLLVDKEAVPRLRSDYTKLNQILTNLVNNAIKYTDKGKIEIGYKLEKNVLLFFVKDTGPGISKEQQAKVFDRFYRSDDPKLLHHDGAGLGLAICLGLTEILKGKIWLESEPGTGTSFYFSLPHS